MTKIRPLFFSFFLLTLCTSSFASTLSSSGDEVTYTYETEFRSLLTNEPSAMELQEAAQDHADHVIGLFHSPQYAQPFGYDTDLIEGFSGTQHPVPSEIRSFQKRGDRYLWIHYKAQGTTVVLKKIVKDWLKGQQHGDVVLPLLKDLPAIYQGTTKSYRSIKWIICTDSDYQLAEDFYYFYNPFRCPELGSEPIAQDTVFHIERNPVLNPTVRFPTTAIEANNGNGSLTVLYFALGFAESPQPGSKKQIHQDDAWKIFIHLENKLLKEYGFIKIENTKHYREILGQKASALNLITPVSLDHDLQRRYFRTYVKKTSRQTFVVRSALFETENEVNHSPLRSFPKFWKEAWENGDFIYYGGHSNDGKALRTDLMLSNLSAMEMQDVQFQQEKTQIVFLDACSSYAHFKTQYENRKPHNLHLMTQGLVSLFHTSEASLMTLLDAIVESKNQSWLGVLSSIEENQLRPQIDFLYEKKDRQDAYDYYMENKMFPSSLLNISVSN